MSTNNFEAELDDVLGELCTDFTKKKKKKISSSASSTTFHKPHDMAAVSATLRTIMDRENPPPPIILPTKRSTTNSFSESSTAKFQRLDDDEAIDLYSQQSIDELEEELYQQYIINDQLPLEEDDGVEEEAVGVAATADGGEDSDEEVQRVTICEPCPQVSKKYRSSDSDLKNYACTL